MIDIQSKYKWYEIRYQLLDIFLYSWLKPLYSFKEQVERFFYWGWKLRHNYDFDAQTVYELLYLKLDRIYNCMKEYSHLEWNSTPDSNLMRKLAEARGLAKRLHDYDYNHSAFLEADAKFEYKVWSEPIEGSSNFILQSNWMYKEKEAKLYLKARKKHYAKMLEIDKKRFYYLLDKYLEHWWD